MPEKIIMNLEDVRDYKLLSRWFIVQGSQEIPFNGTIIGDLRIEGTHENFEANLIECPDTEHGYIGVKVKNTSKERLTLKLYGKANA